VKRAAAVLVVISGGVQEFLLRRKGVLKTEILFGFRYQKNLTRIQTVQKFVINADGCVKSAVKIESDNNNFTCIQCADKERFNFITRERHASTVPVGGGDRHGNDHVHVCKQSVSTRDDVRVVNDVDSTVTRTGPHLATARLQQAHLRITSNTREITGNNGHSR